MVGICLFGAGRIGQVHARSIAANQKASLRYVVDQSADARNALAQQFGGDATAHAEEALADPDVDAVVIGTPTNTHLELISMAAEAGKPILCEKPIDVNMDRVDQVMAVLERHPVPFTVGLNRRFDPGVCALRNAVHGGEIGDLHLLIITSRDPAPPPIEYVKASGGYFCDSTIHDLDLARWILGEEPSSVFATASCLVEPEIGAVGDVDTAMTVLRTPSGQLCHINNSRRATYGFDQRIEAFGSNGMIQTENQRDLNVTRASHAGTDTKPPLKHFFLERYAESFRLELDEFIDVVASGRKPSITQHDGRAALELALACEKSRREGRFIDHTS